MKRLFLVVILVCYVWCACSSCNTRDTGPELDFSGEISEPQNAAANANPENYQTASPLDPTDTGGTLPVDTANAESSVWQNDERPTPAATATPSAAPGSDEQNSEDPMPVTEFPFPFVPEDGSIPMSGNNGGGDWGEIDP